MMFMNDQEFCLDSGGKTIEILKFHSILGYGIWREIEEQADCFGLSQSGWHVEIFGLVSFRFVGV